MFTFHCELQNRDDGTPCVGVEVTLDIDGFDSLIGVTDADGVATFQTAQSATSIRFNYLGEQGDWTRGFGSEFRLIHKLPLMLSDCFCDSCNTPLRHLDNAFAVSSTARVPLNVQDVVRIYCRNCASTLFTRTEGRFGYREIIKSKEFASEHLRLSGRARKVGERS